MNTAPGRQPTGDARFPDPEDVYRRHKPAVK